MLKEGGWDCSTTPCTKGDLKAEFELLTLTSSTSSRRWRSASRTTCARSASSLNLSFASDDAVNNRIYASGTKKDLYGPTYDAFLWDWDVSGTTPTPILEVLLSDNASSDSFYDSKAYDTALLGARTATTQAGVVAAVRKAEAIELADLPYLPLVHLNATELRRTDTWHGWSPSPEPSGRPLWEAIAAAPRAQARARAGDDRRRARRDDDGHRRRRAG